MSCNYNFHKYVPTSAARFEYKNCINRVEKCGKNDPVQTIFLGYFLFKII